MRWISAKQLEDWARTLVSRTELSKIVSDLIRASAPDIAAIRFPSGDKGQVRGFDGHLVSNIEALNIPEGRSYWEFGTDQDYKSKARRDFGKRTRNTSKKDQRETIFIMVSPWTWDSSKDDNKVEDFIKSCKKGAFWKDIRYIDGAQLETWLEQHPAVSAWHARNTLKTFPLEGIRSTDEFWDHFSGQFRLPIPEDILLCDRSGAAEQLIQDLMQASNALELVADSPDEVLAFAIAAIRKSNSEIRLFLEARTLIVDSVMAGRQLPADGKLILLLRGDAAKSPRQFFAMGTTLVPLGRRQRGSKAPILDRPTAHAMAAAMQSMNLGENQALTLARGSGRSLTALARLMPGGSSDGPAWLMRGAELVPAILAGAWDSSNALDCKIIESISGGLAYSDIEKRLRTFVGSDDPPFDLEGSVWKVRAPMDAFIWIGPLIDRSMADLLREAMIKVFSKIEPQDEANQLTSFSRPKSQAYSDWLREGLATTLDLLAVWSEPATVNLGGETGQSFADRTVSDLPGLRTDYRLLISLRNELQLIAEAAPSPLLSALEHMLEGSGETIRPIFDEKSGLIFPRYEYTGVLWALETIAWDPNYFRRAVMVLARLAAIDPGGRLINRPNNSLKEIFLLWNPNTNASSAERLSGLDEIVRTLPDIGWKLILELMPTTHGTSTPTAKPRLREAGAADRTPVTYGELWGEQAAIAERAIQLAGRNYRHWLELVPHIFSFAPKERESAIAALDEALAGLDEINRKALWEKLRGEVRRHERFASAPWALPQKELEPLRALMENYAPADPISKIAPLFDLSMSDTSADAPSATQQRSAALHELYLNHGADAVLELAAERNAGYLVIEAAYGANFSPDQVDQLFSRSFARDPISAFTQRLSGLYYTVLGRDRATAWMTEAINRKGASADAIGNVLQGWPDDRTTWNVVRSFGHEIMDAYWKTKAPSYLKGSRSDLIRSLIMMLKYGRAIEAIQSSLNRVGELPSQLILRMLKGVIPQLNSRATPVDTMTAYYVEQTLQALDKRSDVGIETIASWEYQFFPFLEHGKRHFKIFELLARNPSDYYSLIRKVFRTKDEEKTEPDPRMVADARIAYSLLRQFDLLPGRGPDGTDRAALSAWIDEVRRRGSEDGLAEVTDSHIGRVFAHSKAEPDGVWPPVSVREQIERLVSSDIERAIQMERFNMRGAHFRAVFEGGTEERGFAEASYDSATEMARWPRTAALLRSIGDMWEAEAKREDVEAAQRRLKS